MAFVPPGEFVFPVAAQGVAEGRRISLAQYRIDPTEVTVAGYAGFAAATGADVPEQPEGSGPDHPVVNVTWAEARAYCRWRGGDLPTEAQWLKAALGGAAPEPSPWLDDRGRRCANLDETDGADRFEEIAPVASFAPNGYGVYDMVGNAVEWVRDWYQTDYPVSMPTREPPGPESGAYRVLRGAGWYHCTNRAGWVFRNYAPPEKRHIGIGFRCGSGAE